MDVVGHDNEATARSVPLRQFLSENVHDDLSAGGMIEKTSSPVTGKRHELCMVLVVIDSSFRHGAIIVQRKVASNPLVAEATPTIFRKHPIKWWICCGKSSVPPSEAGQDRRQETARLFL
jgi:hypothetical protein